MKKLQETIQDTLQKGWTDISATFTSIGDEVTRRLQRAREVMDPRQARDEAQRAVSDFARRMQESHDQLEQRVEETINTVVTRIKGPLAAELANLRSRAERLSRRVESQVRRRSSSSEDAPPRGDTRDG
jgi:hypothetical protein